MKRRRHSLPRALAMILVLALMIGFFAFARMLATSFGEAAALWVLVVVIPLTTWLALHVESFTRQRRRERIGKCACGYDVRATPDRCPECGRIVADIREGEAPAEPVVFSRQ